MRKLLCILCALLCCTLILCVACGKKNADTDKTNDHVQNETPEDTSQAIAANFENITFANQTVEYDGDIHTITAERIPEGATATYSQNSATDVGTYQASVTITKDGYNPLTLDAVLQVTLPQAQSVVDARARANNSAAINYDFGLTLQGTVTLMGYSGSAKAQYDGKYRYDSATNNVQFARTTSGLLLYDATEYITMQGDSKLIVTTNDKGVVKKVNVLSDNDEVLLINRPIAAIVDALHAENLKNIALSDKKDYMFMADLRMTADNALVNKVLSIIAKQGTSINFKEIVFTNPVAGLVLYFNLGKEKKLNNFALSAALSLPVEGTSVQLQLDYTQTASEQAIIYPAINNIFLDKTAIADELAAVSASVQNIKNADCYSVDVEATNRFDPGLTVAATKDRYSARLYKSTYDIDGDKFVAFNHSYEYKTHHEEDGAETYKYTIGNIKDGSVYLISRKGTNTITDLADIDADKQFDWLVGASISADDVDCLRKETKGSVTTYTLYVDKAFAAAFDKRVCAIINSNVAEGVVAVENYFNENDFSVKGNEITVTVNNGKLVSIDMQTTVRYYPIGGEYTQKRITLDSVMSITFNKELDSVQQYEAPKSATTKLGSIGLNNAKYYIQ